MKRQTKILLLLAATLANHALAQGTFRNLNFEETTLPYASNIVGVVSAADAFPGWTVYYGNAPQTQVVYNGLSLPPALSLLSRNFAAIPPIPASFGSFSALLSPTDAVPSGVSLSQMGTIPEGVNSLSFETFRSFSVNSLQVSFGGNLLPLEFLTGPNTSYGIWRADLGHLAGQTDELRITAIHQPDVPGSFRLDNIQFISIPEPRAWALLGMAGALFCYGRRRRRN